MALKLKAGAVQEPLRLTMHGFGQHVQDSVQTHSEIRRQTDENLLIDCIRKSKCRPIIQKYAEYVEYVEYAEYAEYAEHAKYPEYAEYTE